MDAYRCKTCGKYLPIDPSTLGVGDAVTFTTSQQSTVQTRLTVKRGAVVSAVGDTLCVKVPRGGIYRVHRADVTPEGAPTSLTRWMFGECTCGRATQ
ncbi:hypothetical protein [Chitiniphilus eburneus]|uniref:hypothetical protein n=1 Tax=Chitiniphilus eburneus TaxID=2571148 RepID=UPI0035D004E0